MSAQHSPLDDIRKRLDSLRRELDALARLDRLGSNAVTLTGTQTVEGVKTFDDGIRPQSLYAFAQTIGDDAAYSFQPLETAGIIFVTIATSGSGTGIAYYRVNTASQSAILAGGANFEVATGILAGTTGTDGKITVSAYHTTNTVYIENRLGASVTVRVTLIG